MRLPPSVAEVQADFDRLNMEMLRNPSLVNTRRAAGLLDDHARGREGADARLLAMAAILAG